MNQSILDEAVRIATRRAMNGNPVARIVWIPPATAASDPNGAFAIEDCGPMTGSESSPWESQ